MAGKCLVLPVNSIGMDNITSGKYPQELPISCLEMTKDAGSGGG